MLLSSSSHGKCGIRPCAFQVYDVSQGATILHEIYLQWQHTETINAFLYEYLILYSLLLCYEIAAFYDFIDF